MDFSPDMMCFGDDEMKYGFDHYKTPEESNSLEVSGLSAIFIPNAQFSMSCYLEDMLEHEQNEELNIYDDSFVARSARLTSDPIPSLKDDLTDLFPMSAGSSSGISSGGSSPDPNLLSDHVPSAVTTHSNRSYQPKPSVPFFSTNGGVMVSNTGNTYQIQSYTMAAGMISPYNSVPVFGAVQPKFQFQAQPLSNSTPLNTVTLYNENQTMTRRLEVPQPGNFSASAILTPQCTPAKPKKAFCDLSSLILHDRTHTGLRPYRCEICEHTFKQVPHLQTHYRNVHKIEISVETAKQTALDS